MSRLHRDPRDLNRYRLGEETFHKVFVHVVKLCEQKGLVKGKRVMTDGSLIKASAALNLLTERDPLTGGSKPKPRPEQPAGEKAADESGKTTEPKEQSEKKETKSIRGKTFSNKTHVSTTDPESTLAGKTDEPKQLRYKVHQSIDADHRVIVDCHITTGFGEAKAFHGLSLARYRGRWKVQVQAYLTASVQNLKRVMEVVLSRLMMWMAKILSSWLQRSERYSPVQLLPCVV